MRREREATSGKREATRIREEGSEKAEKRIWRREGRWVGNEEL